MPMRPIPLTQGGLFRPVLMTLLMFGSTHVWAQETASLAINEPVSGTNALRNADASQLAQPSRPLEEAFNAAVRLRIEGALEASSQEAERCYQLAASPDDLASFGAACKELAAGNAFIQGDHGRWAKSALDLQDRIRATYAASAGGRMIVLENFVGIDFQSIASAFDGPVQAALPKKVVKVTRVGKDQAGFDLDKEPVLIEIEINGKRETALVDTGSSISVINTQTASRMGLKTITDHYVPISDPSRKDQVSSKLVKVDELALGEAKLNEVAFAVSTLPTIIGLDILQKLSPVLLSREDVTLFAKTRDCDSQSRYRSKWLGDFGLVSKLSIDGKERLVHIDTGDDASIAALKGSALTVSSPVESRSMAAVGGHHAMRFQKKSFQLHSGEVDGEVRPDLDDAFAYRIGSAILKDRDLWIDASHMRACLLEQE